MARTFWNIRTQEGRIKKLFNNERNNTKGKINGTRNPVSKPVLEKEYSILNRRIKRATRRDVRE